METETSAADARDAGLWRGLNDLLGEGVAPSMEDVLEHVAKLKRDQGDRHDTIPSNI